MSPVIATAVSDFLRDAQSRVGDLTVQIIALRDEGTVLYEELHDQRAALYRFMTMLNDKYTLFIGDTTTFLQATGIDSKYPAWKDREILEEIEYLRFNCNLQLLPFFVFVGFYPQVIAEIPSSGFIPGTGWTPPTGTYLQTLRYNSSGVLVAVDFPDYWGMRSATITNYFLGRS